MKTLTDQEVAAAVKKLKGWNLIGKEIRKSFIHKDFVHAVGFVNSVALVAERANHHPDIDVRWNTVTLTLSTHSAGGLTEKDFKLAGEIDEI
ncbi:MAG TPA: 4a-hydroxytetrahydrobiopterin dehydratase [Bacteroidota bacterium]|nr:4a-hydroxytetrahydrobiopterin dehydratase [Bacteroidota bacterium]